MKTNPFNSQETAKILAKVPEAEARLKDAISPFEQCGGRKLLRCGDTYAGTWLEHLQDNVFLAEREPETAWNAVDAFLNFQREDGLLPFNLPWLPADNYFHAPVCYWHVQCVWGFARCALEIARLCHRPKSDLKRIFDAGERYDTWFRLYRNRTKSGLVEMYCEYDTGCDNSPRVTSGLIHGTCPGKDARNMPFLGCMPVLSCDMSAALYANRVALAEIAEELGDAAAAQRWKSEAASLRARIWKTFYDEKDAFFYDRDTHGPRKFRSEHITRMFLNGVVNQDEFDRIYERHFQQPGKGFSSPYPIPSMAIDDPAFVKECPRNCWGANSQGLTMERALLWMPQYHREDDLELLLERWLRAIALEHDNPFTQELNPFTGAPVGGGAGGYVPTIIVFLEGVRRLIQEK